MLADCGVRRVSVDSTLARVALTAFVDAAREIRDTGAFGFGAEVLSYPRVNALWP
jgi:2-methylisocitrate lyase-like PEP mutase family enzyme